MPIEKCTLPNGKSGFRWGTKGKCYKSGKDAAKQGIAIEGEDKFNQIMKAASTAEELEFYDEAMLDGPNRWTHAVEMLESTYSYVSQKERDEMSSEDFGDPEEKKYPVKDEKHFHAAVKLLGRAPKEKQAAIKSRLKKIAKRKGYKLPDSWENEKD